jgi:hypothetical protein
MLTVGKRTALKFGAATWKVLRGAGVFPLLQHAAMRPKHPPGGLTHSLLPAGSML